MTQNGNKPLRIEKIELIEEVDPLTLPERVVREEFPVVAGELLAVVQKLVYEANVRRIMVKRRDKVVLDIPLLLGIGSIALLPAYAALALVAALATDHSIVVERVETA